jgi:hypothetical protein
MFSTFTKKMVENREPPKIFFAPPKAIPTHPIFSFMTILKKENIKPNVLHFYKKMVENREPPKIFFRPSRAIQGHPIFSFMIILKNNICKRYKIEDCNYDT